jgi:ankyrin repeat protein
MRNSWLLLITMLILPVRGFAQENPDNEAGVQTDSTTVQRDNASIQTDTASAQQDSSAVLHEMQELSGPEGPGAYLADTLPVGAWDTSYFSAGDPEYNLLQAADYGQAGVVRMLLDRGIDPDARTDEGVTPLMYASQNGDTAVMDCLIRFGADVNAKPDNEVTSLISATRKDQYEAVRLLLKSGAKVDARDELDLTALMHASAYNYPEIAGLLIDSGAGTEKGDWFGTRPLMMAAYYNCMETAEVLLRRGADPNGTDLNGFTPLMVAVQHGDYDMAWMLLDHGANPNLKNLGGLTALAMAVIHDDRDLAELLLESGAKINQNINSSTNVLGLAKEAGEEEMADYLLSNAAHPNRVPEISEVRGGFNLNFNGDDFMLGFEGGVTENKYHTFLTTGFMARPKAIRILRPENDSLSFQLWERRYLWPVSLGRNFTLNRGQKNLVGFRVHLTGALTWGGYRGSALNPGLRFLLIPGAGIFWRQKYFGISFDYQYVPIRVYDVSGHRFTLSFQGFYDIRTRLRYLRKEITWF